MNHCYLLSLSLLTFEYHLRNTFGLWYLSIIPIGLNETIFHYLRSGAYISSKIRNTAEALSEASTHSTQDRQLSVTLDILLLLLLKARSSAANPRTIAMAKRASLIDEAAAVRQQQNLQEEARGGQIMP